MNIEVRTPEGVLLNLELASVTLRTLAFLVDMTLITGVYILTGLIALGMAFALESSGLIFAAYTVFFFLFRILYFVILEMRGRGQTPGKRFMGLRVIDSHGRPLTGNATFLRNISRDIEIFLPLAVLMAPDMLLPNAPWWFLAFPLVWILLLALFPVLSPMNVRPGDVIAGTLVVVQPRLEYLHDLSEHKIPSNLQLTAAQLDMYGIHEVQLLEKILRNSPTPDVAHNLAEKIATKLGLPGAAWNQNPLPFLQSVYAQLRTRHEQRILFGDRQHAKREGVFEPTKDDLT